MDERQKTFWPLPGGWKKYTHSLNSALKFISDNEPSVDKLVEWFLNSFEKVNIRRNARGYVNNVIKTIGFVNFDDTDNLKINEAGLYYLKNQDIDYLSNVLLNTIYGFKEILLSLDQGDCFIEDISERVSEYLKNEVDWNTTYPIKYRIDWLRCLDLVKLNGVKYVLTPKGKHFISSFSESKIEEKEEINKDLPQQNPEVIIEEKPSHSNQLTHEPKSIPLKGIGITGGIKQAILDYENSYKRGVEKFGIWWKIFNWSILAIALIFLITAAGILIFVMPNLEMIKYI